VNDLEAKRKELKETKDDLELSKRLGEQLREENKKLKQELEDAMEELIGAAAQMRETQEAVRGRQAKSTDTVDLVIQRPKLLSEVHAAGGEDYFEMKKRIRDLEDQLRRTGSDFGPAASEAGDLPPDQELRKLLDDIQKEQQSLVENGDAPDRVKRIQTLVYQFIYGILSTLY
jgi:chromosome segregation ATPase